MRPFQNGQKQFINGCTFDEIVQAYEFDRELRLLCLDAIERCEVALRAAINDTVAVSLGSHFYLDPNHFDKQLYHTRFLNKVRDSKSIAISYYKNKYSQPADPPVWAAMEAISFGTLSKFFADLKRNHRKAIAARFNVADQILVTWFHCISVFRNICAHHHRIWNVKLTVNQPKVSNAYAAVFGQIDEFQARAVILYIILACVDKTRADDWRNRLRYLFAGYSHIVQPQQLGFRVNDPFWTLQ